MWKSNKKEGGRKLKEVKRNEMRNIEKYRKI